MKTKNFLKKLTTVIIGLSMVLAANALTKTTALTLSDLQTQFAAAKVAGVRDTINIGAAIAVNVDLALVATGDTIIINMAPFGISVTAGTLTIGNKVKVVSALATAGALQANGGSIMLNAGCFITTTTANTLQALAASTITINGGTVSSTATSPVVAAGGNVIVNGGTISTNNYPAIASGMAINTVATGGTVTVNGGLVYTTATGIARGIVVDYNGVCTVNGGLVRSDMGGGRGISINGTNAGGKLYVYGGTISALGATGRAIQLDNNNATLWVTGGTITGGLEAIMVQKIGVAVIVSSPTITGVIGTNTATAKLYDARGLSTPVATPGQGYYAATQNVTVTGGTGTVNKYTGVSTVSAGVYSGAGVTPTTVSSFLVYTTDGTDPVVASAAVSAPISMVIPSTLKVAAVFESATVSPNIKFGYWTIGTPMTSAPMPTAPANKVASIFSDAYTSAAGGGTNYNPGWGQATVGSIIQVGTDNVLKYTNLNYQGTQFANAVNTADLKYLHVDIFSATETSLTISCISPATPANKEFAVALTPINLNAWNSYDIPITSFTGVDMSNLIQLKVVGSGGKTVYLDNIYFWTDVTDTQVPTAFTAVKSTVKSDEVDFTLNATDNSGAVFFAITYGSTTVTTSAKSGVDKAFAIIGLSGSTDYTFSVVATDRAGNSVSTPITILATTLTAMPAAPTPTYDALKVISIFSDTYTNIMGSGGWENWYGNTFSTVLLNGNTTLKDIATCCFGVSFTTTTIDVTSMNNLHVDIYPVTATTMTLGFIVANTAVVAQKVLTLTTGQWNSVNIPFADLKAASPTADFTQVKQMSMSPASGTFYLDNLLFYNDGSNAVATVAASSIKCYPSQVVNTMNVSADSQISSVLIRNLLGQSVKMELVNSNLTAIDLSALTSGNYLLTVSLSNGETVNKKIVKL